MSLQSRSDDAVLTVCQNNRKQAIEISAANPAAIALLGYSADELAGMNLIRLLPPALAENIPDYVEFETGGNDIGTVLTRSKEFRLVNKAGTSIPLTLKAVRSDASDEHDWFKLILRTAAKDSDKDKLLALLMQNFKGHEVLDESFALPDRNSMLRNAELVDYHIGSGALQACFAVIELDQYVQLIERYSRAFSNRALKEMSDICLQNLRGYDTVGVMEGGDLALLLLDITPDSARLVLNRLRWLLTSKLTHSLELGEEELSVSVALKPMAGNGSAKDAVLECENLLRARSADSRSVMLEAVPTQAAAQARKV